MVWTIGSAIYDDQIDLSKVDVVFEFHPEHKQKVKEKLDEIGFKGNLITDITKEIPLDEEKYFTSSIAYLLGIIFFNYDYCDGDKISIQKVHLSQETEYYHQRPCIEYWLGKLEQIGYIIEIAKDCEILKSPYLYVIQKKPVNIERIENKRYYLQKKRKQLIAELSKRYCEAGYQKRILETRENLNEIYIEGIQKEFSENIDICSNIEAILNQLDGAEGMLNYFDGVLK